MYIVFVIFLEGDILRPNYFHYVSITYRQEFKKYIYAKSSSRDNAKHWIGNDHFKLISLWQNKILLI